MTQENPATLPFTGPRDSLVRGSTDAAGLDLRLSEDVRLIPGQVTLASTGVHVAIPSGHFGLLVIRSSMGVSGVTLANQVGIIDPDYRGEIKVALVSTSIRDLEAQTRVAQLIILPFTGLAPLSVPTLDDTERGHGGFGSTGEQ